MLRKDKQTNSKPLYCIANAIKGPKKSYDNAPLHLKSSRNKGHFINQIRAKKDDKEAESNDYFSFSSPVREDNKENKSKAFNRIDDRYPELELYPNVLQTNESKLESNLNSSRIKNNYLEQNLNRSLKTAFEYNTNDSVRNSDANNNYMIVKETELPKSTYDDTATRNSWNERVKKLSKKLDVHNSKETIDSSKIKVHEKLKTLVKTVKSNTSIKENNEPDVSYRYKKRESSLQRMGKPNIIENDYQRRSFNNNVKQTLYEHRGSSDNKQSAACVNTILKENIKRKRNNQDMPLQKLRMKQKVGSFKSNFQKTNEAIKANIKKKISDLQISSTSNDKKNSEYQVAPQSYINKNYQDALKQKFYKNNESSIEADREPLYRHERNTQLKMSYTDNSGRSSTKSNYKDNQNMAPKYPLSTNSILDKNRNRFITNKPLCYDRIGSKSPATRKRNAQHHNYET